LPARPILQLDLTLAESLQTHDPNATVLTVFGSCTHDAHRHAVPLDHLVVLKLVVEASGRPLGLAVDVNDVVEGVCHNCLGSVWEPPGRLTGQSACTSQDADERT